MKTEVNMKSNLHKMQFYVIYINAYIYIERDLYLYIVFAHS